MKKVLLFFSLIILAQMAYATTTTPEALPSASGTSESSSYLNFGVLGEPFTGTIGNTYVSGVGIAAQIFKPLLPNPEANVPTITTIEGTAISYPNPFNPEVETATIAYQLTADQEVKVYIIDMVGQTVQLLTTNSSNRGADGYSRVTWNGSNVFKETVTSGIYLIRVVSLGKQIGKTIIAVNRW